jgi:hypothetical protein
LLLTEFIPTAIGAVPNKEAKKNFLPAGRLINYPKEIPPGERTLRTCRQAVRQNHKNTISKILKPLN